MPRRAVPADSAALRRIHLIGVALACIHDTPEHVCTESQTAHCDYYGLAIDRKLVLVHDEGTDIVAFALVDLEAAVIELLCVDVRFAADGVSDALLLAIECEVRQRGLPGVTLMASMNAVGFYMHHGYCRGATELHDCGFGIHRHSVIMSKVL